MDAKVYLSLGGKLVARIHRAQRFDMALGAVADVELTGVQGRVDWSADNDETLEIEDDAGLKARITATALGQSTVELKQRGRPIGVLIIEVIEEETVKVDFSFSNVRPVDKP